MPAEDRRNPCSKAPLPSTSCVEGGLGRDCAEIGPRLSLGVGIAVERRAEEAPHAAEIDEIDEVSHLAAEIDEVSHLLDGVVMAVSAAYMLTARWGGDGGSRATLGH